MWPPVASMMLLGWLCCVWLAAVSADSEPKLYMKVGDEVVLKPDDASVPGTIESILWKHGGNIAAELDDTGIELFRQFKDRVRLNISTGEMTITGLTGNDSGVYTAEINNILISRKTHLIVLSPVPVPTVNISCDDEKTSCILSCDGNTTGAGEINYTWKSDGKESASSKNKNITKDSSSIKEFSCKLENRVSQESSQPVTNPLFTSRNNRSEQGGGLKISTGVTVFISLLAALLMLVFIHRCKAGMWFFQKDAMPWEADFWRKNECQHADSNGTTRCSEKELTEEETPMT